MRTLLTALMALTLHTSSWAADTDTAFVWFDGKHDIAYHVTGATDCVATTALGMLSDDLTAVTGHGLKPVRRARKATIRITQLDRAERSVKDDLAEMGIDTARIAALCDGFHIGVYGKRLEIVGANGRGTAYALLELSRLAGVTPWVWWADLAPERRSSLTLPKEFSATQGADVEWRGVFINDEDWSLRPWSANTYEPEAQDGKGDKVIGPRTYRRIFELLMRLRANTVWPAMHEGTRAFFLTPGAKAVADSCGIAIGTSHCEPLLRNNPGEWDKKTRGDYNYMTNREAVTSYWAERLREVSRSEGGNLLTIGMRGIHDGSMEGVTGDSAKLAALQMVIDDQQRLIGDILGDPKKQTQVFVPYKEVLDIYERGLKVPDHVTLMWCDDNYGYLTRLSTPEEQRRSGGAGIYYHLSYWGRPHDYLWLGTTQPGLIYNELREAYDHDMRKLWVFNIHEPRVTAYNLELALDMAWDIDAVTDPSRHHAEWVSRTFGSESAKPLAAALRKFYQLCAMRRPEFMGWTQVELSKRTYPRGLSPIADSDFSLTENNRELDRYLASYAHLREEIERIGQTMRTCARDAYFSLVAYPTLAAEAHARKLLEAQRARQLHHAGADHTLVRQAAARSIVAYDDVKRLTAAIDTLNGGKWHGITDCDPRRLPVFGPAPLPLTMTLEEARNELSKTSNQQEPATGAATNEVTVIAADDAEKSEGSRTVRMLGHSTRSVALPKNGKLTATFEMQEQSGATIRVALIPTHPVDNADMAVSIRVDDADENYFLLREPFRSEQWKQNVLRNQVVLEIKAESLAAGRHTVTIEAQDEHIVVDQIMVDRRQEEGSKSAYLFPQEL